MVRNLEAKHLLFTSVLLTNVSYWCDVLKDVYWRSTSFAHVFSHYQSNFMSKLKKKLITGDKKTDQKSKIPN